MRRIVTGFTLALLTAVALAAVPGAVAAQESTETPPAKTPPQATVVTPRGPLKGDEVVSLSRDMTWAEALEVIQRASRQIFVFPGGGEEAVGVGVNNRPWPEALDILLSANHLDMAEREGYFEIVVPAGGAGTKSAPPEYSLASRQVKISALFFVADRSALREIGINWSTVTGGVVNVEHNPLAVLDSLAVTDNDGVGGIIQGANEVGADFFSVGGAHRLDVGSNTVEIKALLKALETRSLGEIIASPQITVVNGKQGVVFVGRDFATTVTDFAGNAVTRFHKTGTNLQVTPKVITEAGIDFIHLSIATERSSLIDPVQQIIDKTNAETDVLLFDGEETVIAGLFQVDQTHLRQGVPFLKDLPWWFFGLRYLFGHDRQQEVEKELVIILKAELVPTIQERIRAMMEEKRRELIDQAHEDYRIFRDEARQRESEDDEE